MFIEMRSENEMFGLIMGFAEKCDNVRAVYMNGSRANPNAPKDAFRDYDIVYVVKSTLPFIENKEWLKYFGEQAIIQEPDMMDSLSGMAVDFSRCYAFLVLFKDGNRIDFTLIPIECAEKGVTEESQTVILLDKDKALPCIPPCSDKDFYPSKPSEFDFSACHNEFYWCLNNVGKGIVRRETPYAMAMFNGYVRAMLDKMTVWYIGTHSDFSVSSGKMGKYFKTYLPESLYSLYLGTYSDSSESNIWASVFSSCRLFETEAEAVAAHFGFRINVSERENTVEFLKNMEERKYILKQ